MLIWHFRKTKTFTLLMSVMHCILKGCVCEEKQRTEVLMGTAFLIFKQYFQEMCILSEVAHILSVKFSHVWGHRREMVYAGMLMDLTHHIAYYMICVCCSSQLQFGS